MKTNENTYILMKYLNYSLKDIENMSNYDIDFMIKIIKEKLNK